MKVLAVDIGTGTQDIFLYDSRVDIENGFKLVVPSPTLILRRKIQAAAHSGQGIVLKGCTMGGGPSAWAVEDHIRQGLPVYATPQAARTVNDDLQAVIESGIQVISEDEADALPEQILRLEMRDFNFSAIENAFAQFGISLSTLDAIAVAVFDHGAAPRGISDRKFRFDYLDERIRDENRLTAFAYPAHEIPKAMTCLKAVAQGAADLPAPLVVMDTAPAAILGATFDPLVSQRNRLLVVNIGNFHTLAFRLGPEGIEGLFEHHTGFMTAEKLELLIRKLADGTLKNEDVFEDMGHGALLYSQAALPLDRLDCNVVITGPRRAMMKNSSLRPYFAVPFGDMMIAGCFGLLAAVADIDPELAGPIHNSLKGAGGSGTPPWEIEAA